MLLNGINAYLFAIPAHTLKTNLAINQGKQRIIRTTANVLSRMDVCAALANQNVAGQYMLTIGTLDTQPFGLRITAVFGGTYTFLCAKNCMLKRIIRYTSETII